MRAAITLILNLLAAVAVLAGLLAVGYGFALPYAIDTSDASAIQMTQIYTMGMYYAVLGVALFAFAGVCVLGGKRGE